MAAAGSGQEAAGIAVAGPMALHLLRGQAPAAALANGSPEPGRTQLGACPDYLPGCARPLPGAHRPARRRRRAGGGGSMNILDRMRPGGIFS